VPNHHERFLCHLAPSGASAVTAEGARSRVSTQLSFQPPCPLRSQRHIIWNVFLIDKEFAKPHSAAMLTILAYRPTARKQQTHEASVKMLLCCCWGRSGLRG
jgi:hypothetical protein